jgi:hypothetical protein
MALANIFFFPFPSDPDSARKGRPWRNHGP